MLGLGRMYVNLESQRDELLDEVAALKTARDTQAQQAEFLRGKLRGSMETVDKLTKELQSKDSAFKHEKEQLEILLHGVVDSLSGASGIPVKLTGRLREDALDQVVASV